MKNRAPWLAVSLLVSISFVLSSCAPAPAPTTAPATTPATTTTRPTTSAPPTTTTAPPTQTAATTPKYGGVYIGGQFASAATFEDFDTFTANSMSLTNQHLSIGDWAKGPAGSNVNEWWWPSHWRQDVTGAIAESWDLKDPNNIVFHIRKDVRFALNSNSEASKLVNGREVTAQDVVYCIQRKFGPGGYLGNNRGGWLDSVTATDKYTVTIKCNEKVQRTAQVFDFVHGLIFIYPPEVVQKYGDLRNWQNSVGTGAFMLTDYISDSSYTFSKNANFWMTDSVGPGKGNRLPYLDTIKWLIIPDKSTRIAALRTGKLDTITAFSTDMVFEDKESLLKTNPQLLWKKGLTTSPMVQGRIDKADLPFKDIRVRKAMMKSFDYNAIKDQYFRGDAKILCQPIDDWVGPAYTPLDKLPADVKDLFTYDVAAAKKLLADAGYPNGFKTSIVTQQIDLDYVQVAQSYLAKIGIDMAIDLKEPTIYASLRSSRGHTQMIFNQFDPSIPLNLILTRPPNFVNGSFINDPYINDIEAQIWDWNNVTNVAKQNELLKTYALYALGQAYIIQLPTPYKYNLWQPWVKNYHGENTLGYGNAHNYLQYVWVDQDLKKQMR